MKFHIDRPVFILHEVVVILLNSNHATHLMDLLGKLVYDVPWLLWVVRVNHFQERACMLILQLMGRGLGTKTKGGKHVCFGMRTKLVDTEAKKFGKLPVVDTP